MSSQFLNNFYTYQHALRRVGLDSDISSLSVEDKNTSCNIDEVINMVSNAETNLNEVRLVSDSYNEILKMIM